MNVAWEWNVLVFVVDVHKALDCQCEQGKSIDSKNQIKYELEKSNGVWQISGEMNSAWNGII